MTKEQQTYQNLLDTLQADPIWQEKIFPGDFERAVADELSDFENNLPGRYNDAAIYKNAGIPGAFMAVTDAWQSAMRFNEDTHGRLWKIFNDYKNSLAHEGIIPTPATGNVMEWIKANPLIAGGIVLLLFVLLKRKE